MKKLILCSTLMLLFISSNVYCKNTMTEEHMGYIIKYCEDFNVYFNLAVAILLVENPELNADAIRHNNNGTVDYGYYQINSFIAEEVMKKCGCTDIMDPRQNIKCGIYVIYRNGVQLTHWDIPITNFNLSVMYHRPADMRKIWFNREVGTIGEAYGMRVLKKMEEFNN